MAEAALAAPATAVAEVPAPQRSRGPYLRIEGVSKRFGSFTALDAITLEVHEGEFVCFLGPSGCGKTTLLRAIAGLDVQSSGRIIQAGQEISALPPNQRDFGIVFQSYALFPNLTVVRNVAYGLENRRTPRAETGRRVDELLHLVGLVEHAHKYPAQLSGGQQQRVALARALATSPGLLLLDEPLSALDAKVRLHLRHEVRALQRRLRVTTIMVTHDQEEALTMADRIVVMNDGVIEQVGTPLEVYGEPRTAFVADFIGSMNFLPGQVTAGGAQLGGLSLACATTGFASGSAVTVAIRPEDIVVQDVREGEANTFQVEVTWMEFLGSYVRAQLKAPAIESGELAADLSVNAVRRLGIAEGRGLLVRLPPERLRVYPRD